MRWLCHWQRHCIALCLASRKTPSPIRSGARAGAAKKQGEGGGGRRAHGISKRTIERSFAKAEGKKPKPQPQGYAARPLAKAKIGQAGYRP